MHHGGTGRVKQVMESRREKEERKTTEELTRNHQRRLEILGDVVGRGRGAGDGQRQMEEMRCPMFRPAREGLSSLTK